MKRFAIVLSITVFVLFGSWVSAQNSESKGAAPANPQQPQVTPQQGQSPAQQQQDLAECYDVAKAKTGIDLRELSAMAPAGLKIPGTENLPSAAASGAPAKAAASASTKAMLANQACLKARGYLMKNPAPKAIAP